MERKATVAGKFYPERAGDLKKEVTKYLKHDATPRKAKAAIAPHAGYVYSGEVAGKVFASVVVPEICIVLCPNHSGMGADCAIMTEGSWVIPTGIVPINTKIGKDLLESCSMIREDSTAHMREHSLEVQLPFLLERQPHLQFVPICLSRMNLADCITLAETMAKTIELSEKPILIVASTDMNHYESQAITLEKDRMAIDKVLSLDATQLIGTCAEHRISMCGVIPAAVAILACKELGASKATLIEHKTSGDVSGDYDAVVGYAGFIIE